jgi:hypothetical protein
VEILQLPWSRRCPLVNTPHLSPQLNCSANCFQDNSSARSAQKTQPLYCCSGLFTVPLHSNGHGADHIQDIVLLLCACMLRALPINGRCLQSHCLAMGLHTTVSFFGSGIIFCLRNVRFHMKIIIMNIRLRISELWDSAIWQFYFLQILGNICCLLPWSWNWRHTNSQH